MGRSNGFSHACLSHPQMAQGISNYKYEPVGILKCKNMGVTLPSIGGNTSTNNVNTGDLYKPATFIYMQT